MGPAGDAELVDRALDHDQAAWNALVDKYTRLVWHVIHGFPQLDPDGKADIHQTVWLRLAEQLDAIREPSKLGGWLATTTRRECIRQVRRAGREIPEPELDDAGADAEPDRQLIHAERDAALWQAFALLDTRCQQLLRLLMAEPAFSYDEIAEILDIPRGSIGPTRQRCLAKLRASLEGTTRKEAP